MALIKTQVAKIRQVLKEEPLGRLLLHIHANNNSIESISNLVRTSNTMVKSKSRWIAAKAKESCLCPPGFWLSVVFYHVSKHALYRWTLARSIRELICGEMRLNAHESYFLSLPYTSIFHG